MIITISGRAGSGKSTVAGLVAKMLGCNHYSAGDLQRELAREHGLTITEFNKLEAEDDNFDRMVDDRTRLLASQDNLVVDGWLAPMCIPASFRVFLDCDESERVNRRLSQKREEESLSDRKNAVADMRHRETLNRERWKRYYSYDFLDMKNYDMVIDTTSLTIEQVVRMIVDSV